jgi:hypothetical protein
MVGPDQENSNPGGPFSAEFRPSDVTVISGPGESANDPMRVGSEARYRSVIMLLHRLYLDVRHAQEAGDVPTPEESLIMRETIEGLEAAEDNLGLCLLNTVRDAAEAASQVYSFSKFVAEGGPSGIVARRSAARGLQPNPDQHPTRTPDLGGGSVAAPCRRR